MKKLPLVFLGTAEAGFFFTEILLRLHLLKFYTGEIGLAPYLAGIAIALSLIWDAISDPLMGYLSDHFPLRLKIGKRTIEKRRVFYMIAGTLLTSLLVIVLFSSHGIKEMSQPVKFFFLFFSYFLLNTALTVAAIPHSALCSEASMDPEERNRIFGFRLFWGNTGLLAGILLPVVFPFQNVSPERNIVIFLVITGSGILASLSGFPFDNHHVDNKRQSIKSYLKDMVIETVSLFKNRYYAVLLFSYFVAYLGIGINSSFALFYYEYYLKFSMEETSIILILFLLIWTLSIPLWIYLAKYFEKKWLLIFSTVSLGLLTVFSYPNFPPGELIYPVLASIFGGILVSSIVLMDTLIADLSNYDYVVRKFRAKREGLFFGFSKMVIKISRAIAIIISGLLLDFIGFQSPSPSREVAIRISYIFGYGVGVFFFLSGLIFLFFSYNRKKHEKVLRYIRKRENPIYV